MLHFGKIPKKFGQNLAIKKQILANFAKFCKRTAKNSAIFDEKIEIRERCRKKETLVLYSYSINIRMLPTWSRSGNHRSILDFLFVDTLHLSRGTTE